MRLEDAHPSALNKALVELTESDRLTMIELYKLAVEMADRVSQRRQQANAFYLSINTALITGSIYIGSQKASLFALAVLSIIGISISAIWWRNISSYRLLNGSKFAVIHQIEQALPASPYRAEWDILERDTAGTKYLEFHQVERIVPYVFGLLHLVNLVATTFS